LRQAPKPYSKRGALLYCVAYADFVTAMMALFIVLWLLNQSPKIQAAVGGYFRDPNGTASKPASDKPGVSDRFVLAPGPWRG